MFKSLIELIREVFGRKKYLGTNEDDDLDEIIEIYATESWEITYKMVRTEVKTRKRKSGIYNKGRILCSHLRIVGGKAEYIPHMQWLDECNYCHDNPNSSMIIEEEK